MKLKSLIFALATAAITPAALAIPLDLYNTGTGFAVDAVDTNYTLSVMSGATLLSSNSSSGATYGYVADSAGWPDGGGPWMGALSGPGSAWLTPSADEAQTYDATTNGVYRWRQTFTIGQFLNAGSAYFTGRFAADNHGYVYLNGVQIGYSGGFGDWSYFSAYTGFVQGMNVIDFVVTNDYQSDNNPTGLRVEFTSSFVSEPGTLALALAGIGMVGSSLRRRKQQA